MLFLLSPAKSLNDEPPASGTAHSQPLFVEQSAALIEVLKHKTQEDISRLMTLSDKLAELNVARYAAWSPKATASNAKQAVLAFNGDVYDGLNAKTLSPAQLDWAQAHVCILSGLYGVLRPLDLMQPYRLEMGTTLATQQGSNLYQFWGRQIADYLNERAATQTTPLLINLASQEYFKAVDRKALRVRVVDCVFEELRGDRYKIISFSAKRARGLMLRYALERQATSVSALQGFQAEGYQFDASVSAPERLVFRRPQPG